MIFSICSVIALIIVIIGFFCLSRQHRGSDGNPLPYPNNLPTMWELKLRIAGWLFVAGIPLGLAGGYDQYVSQVQLRYESEQRVREAYRCGERDERVLAGYLRDKPQPLITTYLVGAIQMAIVTLVAGTLFGHFILRGQVLTREDAIALDEAEETGDYSQVDPIIRPRCCHGPIVHK